MWAIPTAFVANISLNNILDYYTVNMTGILRLSSDSDGDGQWIITGNLTITDAVSGDLLESITGGDIEIDPGTPMAMGAYNVGPDNPVPPGLLIQVGPTTDSPPSDYIELISNYVPLDIYPGYSVEIGMIVQRVSGSGTINATNCGVFPQAQGLQFSGVTLGTSAGPIPIDMLSFPPPRYPLPCKIAVEIDNPDKLVSFTWNVQQPVPSINASALHRPRRRRRNGYRK